MPTAPAAPSVCIFDTRASLSHGCEGPGPVGVPVAVEVDRTEYLGGPVEGFAAEPLGGIEALRSRLKHLVPHLGGRVRNGTGGDDPPRAREDGATCWRVSLQIKTPSARRLHYWHLNDGSIELASIRLHDDMRP